MPRRPSNRSFTSSLSLAGAFAIALSCTVNAARPVAAADTVRFGFQIGALGALRLTLPQSASKHNLTIDIKDFRDSTAAMLAVEQGEVDIANATAQHLVRAMEEGIPVVWVAGWGGGYNVLVAAKTLNLPKDSWPALADLAKKRAADNKKLKIGVPTGSMQHLKIIAALKAAAINPDKDVDIVNIPFPTHPRAIEGGEVDLAMTLATFGALSIQGAKGALFAHLYGGANGKQEIGFIVRRDTVEKRPEYLQRVVSSIAESMQVFMSDSAKQISLELKYLKLPEPVIAMVQGEFLRLNYRTNMEDMALMARQMHEVGWAKKNHAAELPKYVNLTFLQKATGEPADALTRW